MEEVIAVENAFWAGIREVNRLSRVHRDEHLHEREESAERTLMHVLLDLVRRLPDGNATPLEFDVDERQAVDEQHHVSASVGCKRIRRRQNRLPCDLVARRPTSDCHAVEDVKRHRLAEVRRIIGIVSLKSNRPPVDKAVQLERRLEHLDLID